MNRIKQDLYEIGRLLVDAKKIKKGEFMKWVKETCGFSQKTAQNIMKVYIFCLGRKDLIEYYPPTILYKVGSKDFPNDVAEAFRNKELSANIPGQLVSDLWHDKLTLDSKEIKKYRRDLTEEEEFDRYTSKVLDYMVKLEELQNIVSTKCSGLKWQTPVGKRQRAFVKTHIGDIEGRFLGIAKVVNKSQADLRKSSK